MNNPVARSSRADSSDSSARTLLEAAGPGFLVCAYLGRLPAAMNQLGLLLVVSSAGRSLALAGAVVAAVGAMATGRDKLTMVFAGLAAAVMAFGPALL